MEIHERDDVAEFVYASDEEPAPVPPALNKRAGKGDRYPGKPKRREWGGGALPRNPHHLDGIIGEVVLDLHPICAARGVVSPGGKINLKAMMRGTGISYSTMWYMVRDPGVVSALTYATIARLCEYLRCQPGDFLRYVPRDVMKKVAQK